MAKKSKRKPGWETDPPLYLYSRLCAGPPIDGKPGEVGDIVFWGERRPFWIVEWQPDNGGVFAIVDADGEIGLASPDELTRDFRRVER